MTSFHEPARDLPVLAEVDVVVVGRNTACIGAALAARAAGASVMLIESGSHLGEPNLCPVAVEQLTDAPAWLQQAYQHLDTQALLEGQWLPQESWKQAAASLLSEAAISFLLYSRVAGIIDDADVIAGLVIESKAGRQCIACTAVVDAQSTPASRQVEAWIGNIDYDALQQYLQEPQLDLDKGYSALPLPTLAGCEAISLRCKSLASRMALLSSPADMAGSTMDATIAGHAQLNRILHSLQSQLPGFAAAELIQCAILPPDNPRLPATIENAGLIHVGEHSASWNQALLAGAEAGQAAANYVRDA